MPDNFLTKLVGDKRRWRQYRSRIAALPANYRTAVDGIERYLMRFGPTDAESAASLLDDVADPSNAPPRTAHPSARSSATTLWSSSMP